MRSQHIWTERDEQGSKREVRATRFGGKSAPFTANAAASVATSLISLSLLDVGNSTYRFAAAALACRLPRLQRVIWRNQLPHIQREIIANDK